MVKSLTSSSGRRADVVGVVREVVGDTLPEQREVLGIDAMKQVGSRRRVPGVAQVCRPPGAMPAR